MLDCWQSIANKVGTIRVGVVVVVFVDAFVTSSLKVSGPQEQQSPPELWAEVAH